MESTSTNVLSLIAIFIVIAICLVIAVKVYPEVLQDFIEVHCN